MRETMKRFVRGKREVERHIEMWKARVTEKMKVGVSWNFWRLWMWLYLVVVVLADDIVKYGDVWSIDNWTQISWHRYNTVCHCSFILHFHFFFSFTSPYNPSASSLVNRRHYHHCSTWWPLVSPSICLRHRREISTMPLPLRICLSPVVSQSRL